jgi:hypothetical protein
MKKFEKNCSRTTLVGDGGAGYLEMKTLVFTLLMERSSTQMTQDERVNSQFTSGYAVSALQALKGY